MGPEDGLIDGFTSIDDRLKSIHTTLKQIADSDKESTEVKRKDGVTPLPRKKESVDFTTAIQGNSTKTVVNTMPFTGFVDGIVGGWVDGADLSVGFKVQDNEGGTVYFPSGDAEFAAFNDFTYEFPVSFPIQKDQEIAVTYKNNKSATIPINGVVNAYKKLPNESVEEMRLRLL